MIFRPSQETFFLVLFAGAIAWAAVVIVLLHTATLSAVQLWKDGVTLVAVGLSAAVSVAVGLVIFFKAAIFQIPELPLFWFFGFASFVLTWFAAIMVRHVRRAVE